ncbi:MAG: purine-nucleoside phosphorylase [bacterium]|nr:MAG: purine-nucleoside phosphorylase [bacterium]
MDGSVEKKIQQSLAHINSQNKTVPSIGIILGSGLGDFADSLNQAVKIPTAQIPHYPVSTVSGHSGKLVFGKLNNVSLLAVQGRTHYYEGYQISDVAYVVRLMARLGVKLLFVTNAAGGVNRAFKPGDLMLITDHINFLFRNPLMGKVVNSESRWTDMYDAYDNHFSRVIEQVALELKIPLKKGVLFSSTGPTYETAAEIRMARSFGADAVSMSTIPEVLVARANNIKVVGISCITNMATGLSPIKLAHEDVTEIARQVKLKFQNLVAKSIDVIGGELLVEK